MLCKKRMVADLLFAVQIICTLVFGIKQFIRMLTVTEGVSVSMFWSWEFFLAINLILVLKAHRNQPSRATRQTIISYITWIAMITLDLGVMYVKDVGVWNARDSWSAILVAVGIIATLIVGRYKHLSITDPMIKTSFAVFFKVVPQIIWAYNITLMGGAGLAGAAVIAGHITILSRIGQVLFIIEEAGWDRNRIGVAISEISNEVSWLVVTVVWVIYT